MYLMEEYMTLVISKKIDSHYQDFPELNQFFGKDVMITIDDNSSQNKDELLADFFALVKNIDIDQKEIEELREASMI